MDFKEPIEDFVNKLRDGVEKTSTPVSRAGHTIGRAAALDAGRVSHRTIAAQLSDNSRHGNEYDASEVPTLLKLAQDAKTSVGLTSAQTHALLRDQKKKMAQMSQDVLEDDDDGWCTVT